MQFEIKSKVFSGMGVGKEYIGMKPYQDKFNRILGYKPFPGTLNLRVNDEEKVEGIKKLPSKRLESFEFEGQKYSGADIYISSLEGLDVAYLDLDVTDYGEEVLEIIAPVKLREKLDLEDGDEVELVFEKAKQVKASSIQE